jgi:hypothetical protein
VVVEEVAVAVDEGGEFLAEEAPPGHPLEVAASAVVVGAVEDPAREGALQPAEEPLVAGVHPQCHLGLTAVAPEVALAGKDAEQVAHLQVGDVGHGGSLGADLFHRQAPEAVLPPGEMFGCSAAGGDARPFCRRWGCSAVLPPVGMPGCSAAGRDARPFCPPWGCPAVLPPVEIRGGPLCRRF